MSAPTPSTDAPPHADTGSHRPHPAARPTSGRTRRAVALLLLVGAALGIVFWGGLHTALEWTNREAFCIGCHEMYDNVYVEYQQTVHYSNRTGVRASCADCHVPREWGPKMVRKLQASRELWGTLTGSIDTREKFEARRLTLARREWRRMLANDSLECRNCHGLESMAGDRQSARSARQHELARDQGIGCIVCHQGIAHHLPQDMDEQDDLRHLLARAVPPEPAHMGEARAAPEAALAAPAATATATAHVPATEGGLAEAREGAEPTGAVAAITWDDVETHDITLLYPGIAHSEWLTGEVREGRWRHGGGWAYKNGESCYACHFDETERMGGRIVTGAKLEPQPIPGKVAAIPVQLQAAHDGAHLHLRFRWTQPAPPAGETMDAEHAVKLALMLDAGKVEGAERNGCWAACHADSRGMPAGDPARTKYVHNGSLADGVFYDLVQWRSGDNRGYDGHVADSRVMEGGQALVSASGTREGDIWTVTLVRRFVGGPGDIALQPGKTYNFGFAIHDSHAAGRFHHVSLGYTLGIDSDAQVIARRYE